MENIPTPDQYKNPSPVPPPPETYKNVPSNTPPSTPTLIYSPPPNTPTTAPTSKQRHGCLTAWLLFIIVANIGVTVYSVVTISAHPHLYYAWAMPVIIIFGVWTVICAVAIFMWKKWGFYGFIAGAIGMMIVYLVSGSYLYAFTPFISVAVLYAVLNIGKENRGWPQME